jgi:hypothetical protein
MLPDCHTASRRLSTDVRRRKAPDLRKEIACPKGRKGVYTMETMMNEAVLELEKICGGNPPDSPGCHPEPTAGGVS